VAHKVIEMLKLDVSHVVKSIRANPFPEATVA